MHLRTPADQDHQRLVTCISDRLSLRERTAFETWLQTFYPYQHRWLLEPSRAAICIKSRQSGFSHTTAAVATLWAVFLGETTTVVSIGDREAREVVEKSKRHAALLRHFGSYWAQTGKTDNVSDVSFRSGGRIVALPATSGGRSYSGNMFLDEFAYVERPREVWDAATPSTTLGYRLRVVSTPNGVGNLFHQLWTDDKLNDGWSGHMVTLEDAIRDGLRVDRDHCFKVLAMGDPRLYAQMFECQFIDDQQQYLPTEALLSCCVDGWYAGLGDAYFGLDVGHTVDRTVLYIVRKDHLGVRWTCAFETRKRTAYEDLEALVEWAINTWHCVRGCVDATGLGSIPTEQLQRKFGRHRVEGVVFSQTSKEDLATGMYSAFVDKTVRIPRDKDLFNDLCSLKRIVTSAGNVRYDAPRTEQGHADRAWALALALHASGRPLNVRTEVPGA